MEDKELVYMLFISSASLVQNTINILYDYLIFWCGTFLKIRGKKNPWVPERKRKAIAEEIASTWNFSDTVSGTCIHREWTFAILVSQSESTGHVCMWCTCAEKQGLENRFPKAQVRKWTVYFVQVERNSPLAHCSIDTAQKWATKLQKW